MGWRKVAILALLLVMASLGPLVTFAQGNPPFPALERITADNAGHLTSLTRVDSPQPGDLAWLPDDRTLAAGTTEGVFLYDVYNLDAVPSTLPAWQDVHVDPVAEVLVSGGQWWDWQTGEAQSAIGNSASLPNVYSPDQRQMATYAPENNEIVVRVWEVAQPDAPPLVELHTGLLDLDMLVFHPSAPMIALAGTLVGDMRAGPAIRMWDYTSDTLIDFLPDWDAEVLTRFQFVHGGDYLLAMYDTLAVYGSPTPSAYLLSGTTTELVTEWKLWTPDEVTLNPDETLLAVDIAYEGRIHVFDLTAGRETQVLSYTDSRTFGHGKRARNTSANPFGQAHARSTPVYLFAPRFSPNGRYLITGGEVSTDLTAVLLWAVQADGQIVGPVSQFDTGCCIPRFTFSPDDAYLWVSTQVGMEVRRFPSGELMDTSTISRGALRQVGPYGLATFLESEGLVVWISSLTGSRSACRARP